MSLPAVVRETVAVGAVPADAADYGKDGKRWEAGDLTYRALFWKNQDGRLAWNLQVGDSKFDPALERQGYGGMLVTIMGAPDSIDWPSGPSAELTAFLTSGLAVARGFVVDREDLCSLLASEGDVARGNLKAWLPIADLASRLVEALILAGDMGLPDVEDHVRGRIHQDPVTVDFGRVVDITADARSWAKQFGKVLGLEIKV
jgi:hypothetical protein